MIRLQLPALALSLAFSAGHAFAAPTIHQAGTTTLDGSEFRYTIFLTEPGAEQQRHIVVRHLKEKYEGPLAEMSFRDRHLQVFGITARLSQESCPNGVGSLGAISISKDAEREEDPDVAHPQYFALEYSCKE